MKLPLKVDWQLLAQGAGEIRLELMDGLLLQDERWCSIKQTVGPPRKLGKIVGRAARIPIHRLRDFFGTHCDSFFVRTAKGWECFLEIERPEEFPETEPPAECPGEKQLPWLLNTELWNDEHEQLKEAWKDCLAGFDVEDVEDAQWHRLFLGPYLGDWERTAELLKTLTIPEAAFLDMRCQLRQNLTGFDFDTAKRAIEAWPQSTYKNFAEGERQYRFACAQRDPGTGALKTCYERLVKLSPADPITTLEAFLLASFAAVMLGKDMPEALVPDSLVHRYLTPIHRYLTRSVSRNFEQDVGSLPRCLSLFLTPEDVTLLKACAAQMRRDLRQSHEMLDQPAAGPNQIPSGFGSSHSKAMQA